MKKEENSNIIKSILKLLLYIFIILFIYILIMINKELKITKIIFNILKISSPLFFGILIAYLLDPIVVKLEKKNIKRVYASLILFIFIIVIIFLISYFLFPRLIGQIKDISNSVPELVDKINIFINNIISKFSNNSDFKINIKYEISCILKKITTDFPRNCLSIFSSAVSSISWAALSLIVGFYILLDYDKIKENIYILLPKKYRRRLKRLFKDINKDLFSFIKGTLILTIIVFVISLILFSCFKLKAPIFFALFNSVMNIIPYIGPIIGGVPIVIIAFTQSNQVGIFILVSALIIQTLDNFIFQPIVMGKTMSLHPVTIMLGLLIFEHFFGIIGMIIATPVIATIKVVFTFIDEKIEVMQKLKDN